MCENIIKDWYVLCGFEICLDVDFLERVFGSDCKDVKGEEVIGDDLFGL